MNSVNIIMIFLFVVLLLIGCSTATHYEESKMGFSGIAKEIRIDKKGYEEFKDPKTNEWVYTHLTVALEDRNLTGLPDGFQVHHIDENKLNNHPENLIIIHKKDHIGRVHDVVNGRTLKISWFP